jgi:phage terminase large subunit GpA-like protein
MTSISKTMMENSCLFSNIQGVIFAMKKAAIHLVPPPDMLPSEWAENNLKIPLGNAAPGPIRFANAPPQRGMIDAVREPGIRRISYMLAAQTGKTTVMQAIVGYHIDHDAKSQLFCMPSETDMKMFLETKLRPMLGTCKAIKEKVAKQRSREGVNNSKAMSYPGGWLMMSWAGSPRTLRGRSAPIVLADEIDGYLATAEGSPLSLINQRNAAFGDEAVLIESSTPTTKGSSNIELGFELGDKRRWWVPCGDCGTWQTLKWDNVTWHGKSSPNKEQHPESARYVCCDCGSLWDDGARIAAIRKGEWRAEKPFKGHASFHMSELYSTFRRMRDVVQSYHDKVASDDLQAFHNVSLAETYEAMGEQAETHVLMSRRERYAAKVPMGGIILTAGIDMQQDRLECEVVAWGHGEESWSVEYRVFWGDPLQSDVWEDMEYFLSQSFRHESGAHLAITCAAVDTGGTGGNTQAAYEWLFSKRGRRIYGIKGMGGWGKPIVSAPSKRRSGKSKRKIDLFMVGADEVKLTIMRRLAIADAGPGYCHFPEDREEEWFHQLTAEKLMTRYVKGFPVREWHKTRPRNEALDCRGYALAALKILNPSFKQAESRLGKMNVEEMKQEPTPLVYSPAQTPPLRQSVRRTSSAIL